MSKAVKVLRYRNVGTSSECTEEVVESDVRVGDVITVNLRKNSPLNQERFTRVRVASIRERSVRHEGRLYDNWELEKI